MDEAVSRGYHRFIEPRLQFASFGFEPAHFVFACEYAGPGVLVSRHAQPVLAKPNAIRGDDRLIIGKLFPDSEGGAKRIGKLDACQHVLHCGRRAGHLQRQRVVHVVHDAVLRLFAQNRYSAGTQLRDALRYGRDIGNADSLQVIAEHCFHGLVPAILNVEGLRDTLVAVESRSGKPVLDAVITLAHRRFLQGFERRILALHVLQGSTPLLDESGQLLILFAQPANLLADVGKMAIELIASLPLAQFLRRQFLESGLQVLGTRDRLSLVHLAATLGKTLKPRFELLGSGHLDILLLRRFVELEGQLVPLLLPLGQCGLGSLERL